MTRAPAREAPGPGVTGQKHHRPTDCRFVVSAPAALGGPRCEDRISVTGDHLSFDGNCGVRPSALSCVLETGDPTVFGPSLSSASGFCGAGRAARRCRSPTRLHGPVHVRRTSCQAGPEPAVHLPALTWNYVRVFLSTSTCLALLCAVISTSTAAPSEPRHVSGPCVTLGRLRLRRQ